MKHQAISAWPDPALECNFNGKVDRKRLMANEVLCLLTEYKAASQRNRSFVGEMALRMGNPA
jgi:hypothetical protein